MNETHWIQISGSSVREVKEDELITSFHVLKGNTYRVSATTWDAYQQQAAKLAELIAMMEAGSKPRLFIGEQG